MGILHKVNVKFGETSIMLSELFYSMMSFCFIGAIVCVILRLVFCRIKHQKYDLIKVFPIVLFTAYCVGLFAMTVPVYRILRDGNQMINGVYHSVNLIPFKTIVEYIRRSNTIVGISLTNVLGNILLFVPMGILLPIVFRYCHKLLNSLIIGAVISIMIETLQFFLGRNADIDDVLLNIAGTIVGFTVHYAISRYHKTMMSEK